MGDPGEDEHSPGSNVVLFTTCQPTDYSVLPFHGSRICLTLVVYTPYEQCSSPGITLGFRLAYA